MNDDYEPASPTSTYRPIDTGNPEVNRFVNMLAATSDTGEPIWWWLSFVDPEQSAPPEEQVPGGGGFLGVCIVQAPNEVAAVSEAHARGCNPGGAVAMYPIPPEHLPDKEWRNRLLSKDEALAL